MKNRRVKILLTLLILAFSIIGISAADDTEPSAIIKTPPAPKFTDAERQAELARHRAAVFAKMLPNSMMILWSAKPRNYAGDVDFYYRQENNLYYLTALKQTNATLILFKNGEKTEQILFLPKRNPAQETWTGKMYSGDDATRLSGIKTIVDASEFPAFLQAVKDKKPFASKNGVNITANAETAYFLLPEGEGDGEGMAEFNREFDVSKTLTGYKVENARPIFGELRLVKSAYELKLLQHAIDISTEAHMRAMATAKQVKWEYETQAEIEYIFRKRNADYWGYPSIVGCGPNATTLHYEESQGEIIPNSLLLMDVGAEYDHYTADVTRTFPVNGKFSQAQADIYQIVYDAQEAAAKEIKPGASFFKASQAAENVLREGLFKLGLTTDKNSNQFRIWYMHGWGHWLGMNVHDVGNYGIFKAGMVTTNEPGIYIREDALKYLQDTPANKAFIAKIKPAFEKYKNIGVRIEDDMLVTDTGTIWMTKNLPRKMSDIEAFMAKASKEFQTARVQREQVNPTLSIFDSSGNAFLPKN